MAGCPVAAVPEDCWEMLGAIDWFEDAKIPPVSGGSLEQSQSFMACLAFVRRDVNRIRLAKLQK